MSARAGGGPRGAYVGFKGGLKGRKMLLSLRQILMQTIFPPHFFDFFFAVNFLFDANERICFCF